jgi:hypothetical protein
MSEAPITPDRSADAPSNPRGRWRRRVLRVMLVLLLATVGNVGFVVVRWYLWERALWPSQDGIFYRTQSRETGPVVYWSAGNSLGETWIDWTTEQIDTDTIILVRGTWTYVPRDALPRWARARREPKWSLDDRFAHCREQAFGWPFRCAHRQESWAQRQIRNPFGWDMVEETAWYKVEHGTPLGFFPKIDARHTDRVLPTHILWPGMLANTLVWSAIVMTPWVMWRGFVLVRSRRRIARGRCGQCGYDRRGMDAGSACPECGVVRSRVS